VTRLYFCQLRPEIGEVADSHPGYHADDMKEVEFVPLLFGVLDTGCVGCRSPYDGAAVTRDAARVERRTEVSMPLAIKNGRGRAGLGIGRRGGVSV